MGVAMPGAVNRVDHRIDEGEPAGPGHEHRSLQAMIAVFDQDVTALCRPDSKHNADRAGSRAVPAEL